MCVAPIFESEFERLTQFELYAQVNVTVARAAITTLLFLFELCGFYLLLNYKNRNGKFEFVFINQSN